MQRWDADGVGEPILPLWEAAANLAHLQPTPHGSSLAIMDYPDSCVLSYPMWDRPQAWGANMAFRREVVD